MIHEAPTAPAGSTRDARRHAIFVEASNPAPAGGLRAHLANLGQLLGSHAVVAAAGLASLPILARNLGAEVYGRFSLFLLALGILSNLDPARPILVRSLSRDAAGGSAARADAERLASSSAWLLTGAGALVGALVGGPWVAVALAVAVHLHGLTAAPFAALSAEERVGVAGTIRNACWAGALGAVVVSSFAGTSSHGWIWAFAAANGVILLLSRRAAGLRGIPFRPISLRALRQVRVEARDVLGFALASAVVSSCDRFLLDGSADEATFGSYTAQYDLAIKLNILSTALCAVVYPTFSRMLVERDEADAARRFVSMASRIAVLYFAGLLALIAFQQPVLELVLGADFLGPEATLVYPFLLVGVFVHLFGFLVTPYQRARGDFASHRRSYAVAAGLMVVVGAVAVPRLGAAGALLTYMTGRLAEILLVVVEARRMDRAVLPGGRLVLLGAMAALLALAAWAVGPGALVDPPALVGWTR